MGYEAGWFAPLRERLRFRSIPAAAPEPVEHRKRRATQAETSPADDPAPAPRTSRQPTSRQTTPHPRFRRHRRARAGGEERERSVPPETGRRRDAAAVPAAVERPQPTPASEELLGARTGDEPVARQARCTGGARGAGRLPRPLPGRQLAPEARVARVDALLTLDRADEALRALEQLPLDAHRRSTELQLIRGELRARTDCNAGKRTSPPSWRACGRRRWRNEPSTGAPRAGPNGET